MLLYKKLVYVYKVGTGIENIETDNTYGAFPAGHSSP